MTMNLLKRYNYYSNVSNEYVYIKNIEVYYRNVTTAS